MTRAEAEEYIRTCPPSARLVTLRRLHEAATGRVGILARVLADFVCDGRGEHAIEAAKESYCEARMQAALASTCWYLEAFGTFP